MLPREIIPPRKFTRISVRPIDNSLDVSVLLLLLLLLLALLPFLSPPPLILLELRVGLTSRDLELSIRKEQRKDGNFRGTMREDGRVAAEQSIRSESVTIIHRVERDRSIKIPERLDRVSIRRREDSRDNTPTGVSGRIRSIRGEILVPIN